MLHGKLHLPLQGWNPVKEYSFGGQGTPVPSKQMCMLFTNVRKHKTQPVMSTFT